MTSYSFKQVDVFTAQPFYGNPVAVVLNARGVPSACPPSKCEFPSAEFSSLLTSL